MIEENKEECQSCSKGMNASQKGMVVLSFYILLSSIYGNYHLIQKLLDLF